MKEKLLALIGKPVTVRREEHRLTFNLFGILEDGDPDRPGTKFYCRVSDNTIAGATGIEFAPNAVEEIDSMTYCDCDLILIMIK